jgi:hypothetical protein
MLEYWNNGLAPFGQMHACGEKREAERREAMKLGNWEDKKNYKILRFNNQ